MRISEKGEQITDTIITEFDNKEYSVSEPGFDIPEVTNVNASSAKIFGKSSGISATVEILEKSSSEKTTFKLSNSSLYNKLYFAFVNDGYKVSKGDRWSTKALYRIDTIN